MMNVPTLLSRFLAKLGIVNEMHEDVRGVFVGFETRLDIFLFRLQEGLNLHRILVSQLLLPHVVDIAVNVASVERSIPLVEWLAKVLLGRPDLVDVGLASLGQVLLASGR